MKSNRTMQKPKSKQSNPVLKQQSAETMKTNPKNVYNAKIKNSLTKAKTRNSDENHLNSTRDPKLNETDNRKRLIDLFNHDDGRESYFEFNKTPSVSPNKKKPSDITILEEFQRDNFRNVSNCNISSYLNYDLGKSFTSDSYSIGSERNNLDYIKEDISNNASDQFKPRCLFKDLSSQEISKISGYSMPNRVIQPNEVRRCYSKINEVSILTSHDLSLFNKLDISRDSCNYSDTEEVKLL
jgi:hypothetical protein